VLVVVALAPPLDRLADELLYVHMAQHLLLGDIGALLVALGLTGPVLQPLLRRRPLDALRVLSHPLVAFPLWALNLLVWHLPSLYQLALRDDAVHALQHLLFFAFGLNMWLPLLGTLLTPAWFGQWARLAYVGAVRLTGMLLANLFIFSGTAFYPHYARGEAGHGIGAVTDQRIAGAIMMIEGMVLAIGLFAWLFVRGAGQEERAQALVDLAADRDLELGELRAARAVASGQDDALRRRLTDDG
jgi:cytochrome c oxidase assembly factor CtaG